MMNLSPLQKLEDLIKKSSFVNKDGYNPSALLNNNKNDTTRFLASSKLAEIVNDLDRNGIINKKEVNAKFGDIESIDPAEKIYYELIDYLYNSIFNY